MPVPKLHGANGQNEFEIDNSNLIFTLLKIDD